MPDSSGIKVLIAHSNPIISAGLNGTLGGQKNFQVAVYSPEPSGSRGDGGLTTSEREALARLRREIKRLKMEREILAKAAAWFAQETAPNSKRSTDS